MRFKTILLRTTAVLLALTMLVLSGGLAWVAADDYTARAVVPRGVTVSGFELGGLSPTEARKAVEKAFVEPLLEPLVVNAGDSVFEVDPAEFLHADIDGAVAEAFEPNNSSTLLHRAYRRLLDEPVNLEVEPELAVDEAALAARVAGMADAVDYPAVDAAVTLEEGAIELRASSTGRSLDQTASVEAIMEALLAGVDSVDLPVHTVAPGIAEEDLGGWIVIRRTSRTLELWEGIEIDRTYPIAVGAPGYATPRGAWEVTLKRYMPTWGNPGSAWAANMPQSIPPGPSNPLGTRAINLNAPGIRIHGTPNEASIGTAASHGCVRMRRADIEQLYELVEVGMPVFVVER